MVLDIRPLVVGAACARSRRSELLRWAAVLVAVLLLPVPLAAVPFAMGPFAMGPLAMGAETDPAYERFLKINYVFNREHFELAIPQYEKLLAEHPEFAQKGAVHYALALCHYASGPAKAQKLREDSGTSIGAAPTSTTQKHLADAVRHLEAALDSEVFEEKQAARQLLGQCYLSLGEFQSAGKAFSKVLTESSDKRNPSIEAFLGLADAYYLAGRYERAAKAYRKTLDLESTDAGQATRARFYLGMALFHASDPTPLEAANLEECAELFLEVGAAGEKHAEDARYMAALVSERRGDSELARSQLKALLDEPDATDQYKELATFGLARSLAVAGNDDEAIPLLEGFLRDFAASSHADEASLYLAEALVHQSNFKSAVKILNKLRHLPGVGPDAALSLAAVLTQYEKHDKAVSVLESAVRRHGESPKSPRLRIELARARIADGQFRDAITETDALLAAAISPELEQEARYLKAYALLQQQDYEAAVEVARAFLSDHPESALRADARQIEAEGLFLRGKYDAASGSYQAYLEELREEESPAPANAGKILKASFRRAQASYFQGDYESAATLLRGLQGELARRGDEAFFAGAPYLAGDCAYQLGLYVESIQAFGRFLDAVGPETNSPQLADARFKRAHALQLSGDRARARVAYESALATGEGTPQATQIRFELGQLAFEERDLEVAKKHLSEVIAREDAGDYTPYALRLLGWIALQEKAFAQAGALYRRIVETFPDHELASEAEFQAALALQSDGRHEEAQQALARFRANHPEDDRGRLVQLQQAVSLSKLGKTAEALGALAALRDDISAADPPQSDLLQRVLYETAWCHRTLEQPQEAIASYRKLLLLPEPTTTALQQADSFQQAGPPLRRTVRLELAELQFEAEEYAAALKLLDPLLSSEDADAELANRALYRATWCYHKLGDHQRTIRSYERYARNAPTSEWLPELAFLAAKSHLEGHNLSEAAALFKSIYTRYPEHAEAEFALVGHGECLSEERDFAAAAKRFQTFLKAYPESELVYRARFGLGWVLENTGQLDEAIEVYQEVVRETSTPTAARAQFQLGQCHVAQGNYREAVIELLQVSARYSYPEWSAKALLQTGGCFEALEDMAGASKYYKEVVAGFAGRDEARLAKERLSQLGLN